MSSTTKNREENENNAFVAKLGEGKKGMLTAP
jgi:hypothetical protein